MVELTSSKLHFASRFLWLGAAAALAVGLPAYTRPTASGHELLTCENSKQQFSLQPTADQEYWVRFEGSSGKAYNLQFSSAAEYTSVNNQEPSFFLQLDGRSGKLQIYYDTLLLDSHRSRASIKLRLAQHGAPKIFSVDCNKPHFTKAPLSGKQKGIHFVEVWNLAAQGYATPIGEYDDAKYGKWL